MLDLSRAVQVDVQYKNEKTSIVDVLNQTQTNFQMVYPNFTFHLDIDVRDDVFVNMYRNHLEQVLVILL
ncbi:sensor histidine kinase, partial [Salmonella enterica subsp. enterica serovar Enteritidis]